MHVIRWLLLVIILNYVALTWAQPNNPAFPTVPNLPSSNQPPPAPTAITCPAINELVQNPTTLQWEGKDPHRWKGYEMSFESNIDHFAGAQWHGTNIGQIFCVYQSPVKTSFPILVLFHAEVLEPSGRHWSKNFGDYRNCLANKLSDCPFMPAPVPSEKNPYQQLQQMKTQPAPQELGY